MVYVPKSAMASIERYLDFALKILGPVLQAESGVILGNTVKKILTGQPSNVGVNVSP
jgi:hypothetical protein